MQTTEAAPRYHRNPPLPDLDSPRRRSGQLQAVTETIALDTTGAPQFIDLTAQIQDFVTRSEIQVGQLTVHSLHTTAAVVINEKEPLLLEQDAPAFLDRLAARDADYRHDDLTVRNVNLVPDEPANAHAHLQHLLLGGAKVVPIVEGQLALGCWQRIFFVELDGARPRRVLLQVMGIV